MNTLNEYLPDFIINEIERLAMTIKEINDDICGGVLKHIVDVMRDETSSDTMKRTTIQYAKIEYVEMHTDFPCQWERTYILTFPELVTKRSDTYGGGIWRWDWLVLNCSTISYQTILKNYPKVQSNNGLVWNNKPQIIPNGERKDLIHEISKSSLD